MDEDLAACIEEIEGYASGTSDDAEEITDLLRSFDSPRDEPLVAAAVILVQAPDVGVRRELAMFLGRVPLELESMVIDPLVALMTDDLEDIRYWASYSLGALRADSPEIREAFWEGTEDFDPRVRAECVEALARRRDGEVAPLVDAALEDVDALEVQYLAAAAWLGMTAFSASLQHVQPWDSLSAELLTAANERCDPELRASRRIALGGLLTEVERVVLERNPSWTVALSEHRFGRRPHPSEELSIMDHEGNVVGYGAWSLLNLRGGGDPVGAAVAVMQDLFGSADAVPS